LQTMRISMPDKREGDHIKRLVRLVTILIPCITVLSSLSCTLLDKSERPVISQCSLPVRAWWTKSSTALNDLKRAHEFGVNTIIIEHDGRGVEWNEIIDSLAVYDFSTQHRRVGENRQRAQSLCDHYCAIITAANKRGIQSYIMCPEIDLPTGFPEPFYDNPRVWGLIRNRLQEVFRALPGLTGFMLYLSEGEHEVFELPGGETSQKRRARKVIDTVWEACRAENRKLLVTTFIHHPERLNAITEALREIPPHQNLAVVQYCCPNDWGHRPGACWSWLDRRKWYGHGYRC